MSITHSTKPERIWAEIKVFVRGGMVTGYSADRKVKVIVYDYDVDGVELEEGVFEDGISKDEEGEYCIITEF